MRMFTRDLLPKYENFNVAIKTSHVLHAFACILTPSYEQLPRCPTIFYRWFKEISPEPTEWFATRQRYVRTTAVMSMVGHIMG